MNFFDLDDHSRVKLASDEREGRGNYINANYVDVKFFYTSCSL
jgi:protein tyrosine phosphatase